MQQTMFISERESLIYSLPSHGGETEELAPVQLLWHLEMGLDRLVSGRPLGRPILTDQDVTIKHVHITNLVCFRPARASWHLVLCALPNITPHLLFHLILN